MFNDNARSSQDLDRHLTAEGGTERFDRGDDFEDESDDDTEDEEEEELCSDCGEPLGFGECSNPDCVQSPDYEPDDEDPDLDDED